MKTKITLLLAILIATISFAQTSKTEKPQAVTQDVTTNEAEPVPFQLVEIPPLAPKCKTKWKVEKQKKCTSRFISDHVNRKFNTNLVSELGLTGLIRIDIFFTIDKDGKPKNISAAGGPEIINQHAIEVIQNLPQLTPAMQNGELVEVAYKMPVVFQIV